jgi:DNA-binding response OmpR family regulator
VDPIGILILDEDVASQAALRQVLDSEGWQVHVVSRVNQAMAELARGRVSMVIANISMIGVEGPVFEMLRELAQAPAMEGVRTPARVLYLVPAKTAPQVQPVLERMGLPYLLKPYHLHDFLEKISDLMFEAGAITEPIRNVQLVKVAAPRPLVRSGTRLDARRNEMFAGREDYYMTEEELLEYERQEEEEKKKKIKKPEERQM